jgi:hypothetical protein
MTTVEAIIWAPKVLEHFSHHGKPMFIVESDRQFNRDHPECLGWTVALGEQVWKVIGVERHMPASPISAGEKIGLLVEPMTI